MKSALDAIGIWRSFARDVSAPDMSANAAFAFETQSNPIAPANLPTDTLFEHQRNLWTSESGGGTGGIDINITPVWTMGYTGKGISIGVYDTAMDIHHVDLASNINMSKRVYGNGGSYVDPTYLQPSGDEHATAVAGIISAARNGVGVVGIAYDAKLTPINIFDGVSSNPNYIWESLKKQSTFDIANHSWAFTGAFAVNVLEPGSQALLAGFRIGADSGRGGLGTLENVAAGNYRQSGLSTETNGLTIDRHIIVIGATDQQGSVAYYSNPGASLLVVAPSSDGHTGITTSDITGAYGYTSGDYTDSFGGTSAATPQLSGIEANMLQANSKLGWRDVQAILSITSRHTGSDLGAEPEGYESAPWSLNNAGNWNGGGFHYSNDYGFGMVDAAAAVRLAEAWSFIFPSAHKSSNEKMVSTTVKGDWELGHADSVDIALTIGMHQAVEAMVLDLNDLFFSTARNLIVELISPTGHASTLLDQNGFEYSSINSGWELMSRSFLGEDAFGTWKVRITSTDADDFGSLSKLTLKSYGAPVDELSVFFFTGEFGTFWDEERSTVDFTAGPATIVTAATTGDVVLDLASGKGNIGGDPLTVTDETYVKTVVTGDGDDLVMGGDLAIRVLGGRGDDDLRGSGGADRLEGGQGEDMIAGGGGNDTLVGGAGIDVVSYAQASAGITVSLALTKTQNTRGDGSDTLAGFESLQGSALDDVLTGDAFANTLDGGAGNDILSGSGGADVLIGGSGSDLASYASSKTAVTIDLGQGLFAGGDAEGDSLIGVEGVLGTAYDDFLTGQAGADALAGGAGNDMLNGAGGDDLLTGGAGVDVIDGGAGSDSASYDSSSSAVTIDLTQGLVAGGDAKGDLLTSIENIVGGKGADILTGDAQDNRLAGLGGNDLLVGGAGADTLDGGAGIDTVSYAASTDGVTLDLAGGPSSGGDAQGDTLIAIEIAIGTTAADRLIGNGAANRLDGGDGDDVIEGRAGNDTLIGGAGIDTASFTQAAAGVTVSLALSSAQNTRGDGIDMLSGFENLNGSAFDDALGGDAFANTLTGGDGNDVLAGAAGADTLLGGSGNDTASYIASKTAVTIDLDLGLIAGGDADGDSLVSIEGLIGTAMVDSLTGDAGANGLAGGGGNDVLVGADGNDRLEGGAGADLIDGGTGSDTASYAGSSSGVTIDLTLGLAVGGDAKGDQLVGIEHLAGSKANDILTGDAQDNALSGLAGNDTLNGGLGADTLDGGAGNDTASYAGSADAVTIDLGTGTAAGGEAEGDTLIAIESIIGTAGDDRLLGDGGANRLDGGAGDDMIEGRGGNDALIGGTGVDTLTYANAAAGVTVNLGSSGAQNTRGDGTDTLSGFENLEGSAFNDALTGSSVANVLSGGAGNDMLTGGAGGDVLIGGAGDDTFCFLKPDGAADTVVDFNNTSEADTLRIAKSGFGINRNVAEGSGDEYDFEHYFASGDGIAATEEGHGQFLYDTTTGSLSWDRDGTGAAAPVLIAVFDNLAVLHASDFVLV